MLVFCGMNPYFSACPVIVVACMMHLGLFCYVDLPVWHEPFVYSPWRSSCQNMSIDMDCIPAGVLFVGFFPTELLACIALLLFVARQVGKCGVLPHKLALAPRSAHRSDSICSGAGIRSAVALLSVTKAVGSGGLVLNSLVAAR